MYDYVFLNIVFGASSVVLRAFGGYLGLLLPPLGGVPGALGS